VSARLGRLCERRRAQEASAYERLNPARLAAQLRFARTLPRVERGPFLRQLDVEALQMVVMAARVSARVGQAVRELAS
jgi:hypothetical protein